MLWVPKRTISMRGFFWAPKTYVQTDGFESLYNFTLKNFVYLNLWCVLIRWKWQWSSENQPQGVGGYLVSNSVFSSVIASMTLTWKKYEGWIPFFVICWFFVTCWFFIKSTFSKNSFRNIIWVSNSLESLRPDVLTGWSESKLFAKVSSRWHVRQRVKKCILFLERV